MGSVRPGIPCLTDILLEAGVVTAEQIDTALEHQRTAGVRVGEALVELGAASEADIGWALARQLGFTYLDLTPGALDPELVRSFPEGLLRRLLAVPLLRADNVLSVALAYSARRNWPASRWAPDPSRSTVARCAWCAWGGAPARDWPS